MATSIITAPSEIEAFNRGAFPTASTLPESCTATISLAGTAWYFGHLTNPYYDLPCLPSGRLSKLELLNASNWSHYFYSPAVACPIGWATVTTFTGLSPAFDYYSTTLISLKPETSAALCCPTGYEYWTWGHGCSSKMTRNQVVQYVAPTYDGNSGWTRGPVSTKTLQAETAIVGDGVPIWWQSSDVVAATGGIVIPTPAITSMSNAIPSFASTLSSSPSPLTSKGGVTTGVGVGIGVGVLLALLIGVGIGILFRRRSNRRHPGKQPTTESTGPMYQGPPAEMYVPDKVHEIQSQREEYFERHELAEKA